MKSAPHITRDGLSWFMPMNTPIPPEYENATNNITYCRMESEAAMLISKLTAEQINSIMQELESQHAAERVTVP